MRASFPVVSAVLITCACATERVLISPGFSLQCVSRGRPVQHQQQAMREQRRGDGDVFVAARAVVYRDAQQRLVARSLADGAALGTHPAAGAIVFADESSAVLWRTTQAREVVRVSFADGREAVSQPMPLPAWVLRSSASEPAESVVGWPEGDAVVLDWTAVTSWNAGTPPPSPEAEAAAHHEDCGSLRVDGHGQVTSGSLIVLPQPAVPPSPVPERSHLQQRYAGEGVYWFNEFAPLTDEVRHFVVEGDGTKVAVTLPAPAAGEREEVSGVWVSGERVVVLRTFQKRNPGDSTRARVLDVLDRRTGVEVWTAPVAGLKLRPLRL